MAVIVTLPITSYRSAYVTNGVTGQSYYINIPRVDAEPQLTSSTGSYNTYVFENLKAPLPILGTRANIANSYFTEMMTNAGLSGIETITISEDDMMAADTTWSHYGFSGDPGFQLKWAVYGNGLQGKIVNKSHSDGDIFRAGLCLNYFKYTAGANTEFTYGSSESSQSTNLDGPSTSQYYTALIVVGDSIHFLPIRPDAYWSTSSVVTFEVQGSNLSWAYSLDDFNAGTVGSIGYIGQRFFNLTAQDIQDSGVSGGGSDSSFSGGSSSPYQYKKDGTDSTDRYGGDGDFTAWGDAEGADTIAPSGGIGLSLGVWIYQCTYTQLSGIVNALFSDSFTDLLSKFFAGNVENAILRIYGTKFQQSSENTLATRNVYLGSYDTSQSAPAIKQFLTGTLGEVTVSDYFGSFADYDTELYIYLPYVGFRPLSPDKYMNRKNSPVTLKINYAIDFLSGAIVYSLISQGISGGSDDTTRSVDVIMDSFAGNIAQDIPIGGSSMNNMITNLVNAVNTGINTAGSIGSADNGTAAAASALSGLTQAGTQALNSQRQTITALGSLGGNLGALSSSDVYLLAVRPVQHMATNRPHYSGLTTNRTLQLSACSGYIKCEDVYLTGGMPDRAKQEIINKLKQGVYI